MRRREDGSLGASPLQQVRGSWWASWGLQAGRLGGTGSAVRSAFLLWAPGQVRAQVYHPSRRRKSCDVTVQPLHLGL